MTNNTQAFDHWIRTRFIDLNTALETQYAQQPDRATVQGIGDRLKQQLETEGQAFIAPILAEGNTDEGFDDAFDLLGNVGLYMAACRRHEITEPSRETHSPLLEASSLATHIGAAIGVTPRFATAHLTTHNTAKNGLHKRFTNLPAEQLFIDFNTRGILAYKRAADALLKIKPLGLSNPVTYDLLKVAKQALMDVIASNRELSQQLCADDFFYAVRPYYKPYRVGQTVYRGANAGDFAGINIIDMLLGLCAADDPSYSQLLMDKLLYMMPEDQRLLRECMRHTSFMDEFLQARHVSTEPWYQQHLTLFLEVCEIHGQTAIQHHNELVDKYITHPSQSLSAEQLSTITASGPPLPVLLEALEKLRDKRAGVDRQDIRTRYDDIQCLTACLQEKAH